MSQEVNNIEELRKWFRECPALSDQNRFRVNYLSESPTEYAIYASPSTIRYRENVLGEMIPFANQTVNYIFASKESYGAEIQQNLAAMGFYDEVIAWMLEQNRLQHFPKMNEGSVTSIVPTLTAYPAAVGSDAAKYQIQISVKYKYLNI